MDMRTLLKALMALADENAYGLESRAGAPQATINRFLTGKHGDPRPPTVRKLASAYGLTESQLRGDAPLPESLERQLERQGRRVVDAAEFLMRRRAWRSRWPPCCWLAQRELLPRQGGDHRVQ